MSGRLVDRSIRFFADVNGTCGLKRSEVEDHCLIGLAGCDETFPKIGGECDSVNAESIRNVADLFAGGGIDHDDVSAATDEQAVPGRIVSECVPTALAAENVATGHFVVGGATGRHRHNSQCKKKD